MPQASTVALAAVNPGDDSTGIVLGQVLGPFGVKGWQKVRFFGQRADNLSSHSRWWIRPTAESAWHQIEILEVRTPNSHDQVLLVEWAGLHSREDAAIFKGWYIGLPRSALPQLDQEYYWVDLIGLMVVNRQGEVLGSVLGLLATGAHDVLQVGQAGKPPTLIPFVESYIDHVDLQNRSIKVDWQQN